MTSIWRKLHWDYIRNNPQSVFFTLIVYLIFTGALIVARVFTYWCTNLFLVQARACGQVLNFHCAFILIMILRKSITILRAFGLGRYLPLDHYVYFHKLTGWSIALFSAWHTVAHLFNFWAISKITTLPYFALLFSPNLGIGWIAGLACLSGWLLCLVLALMLVLSMPFIRRSGKFEVFYYSHKLYILFFIFLFIHAPNCWKWLALPMMLYCVECISRSFKTKKDQHGLTYIIEGTLLPSRVIRLLIRKPIYFTFNPGDFVYVMVPWITRHEWHPITISSAPEDEYITIHIRAVGEWTNRLYDYFEHAQTIGLKEFLQNLPNLQAKGDANLQQQPDNQLDSQLGDSNADKVIDANTISEHLEAIQNAFTTLSKRTMILPIPQDCDENGCRLKPKKHQYNKKSGKASEPFESTTIDIELSQIVKNNNPSQQDDRPQEAKTTMSLAKTYQNLNNSCAVFLQPLKIHLDGPYGAPSSNIFQTEHAVLIATGIGVTPFASILQSIIYRHTEKKRNCPKCQHWWMEKVPSQRIMSLKKVDFVWINRDHSSFEWFVEKLADLKQQQLGVSDMEQQFLDIHMYVTGKEADVDKSKNSIKKKYGHTLNWRSGRPDWNKLFTGIRAENRGKVTVFYCGRPDLGTSLRTMCSQFNFSFKKEVF